jgi:hypothetical protein
MGGDVLKPSKYVSGLIVAAASTVNIYRVLAVEFSVELIPMQSYSI